MPAKVFDKALIPREYAERARLDRVRRLAVDCVTRNNCDECRLRYA